MAQGFKIWLKAISPTDSFTIIGPQNLSHDVSEPHEIRRSPDVEAQNCESAGRPKVPSFLLIRRILDCILSIQYLLSCNSAEMYNELNQLS